MRYCTFFLLCGLLCCSSKLLQMRISISGFLFQSFSDCAVLLFFCFFGHQRRHIIINVSRSKCDYFVFSVFDMEACVLLMKCILLLWQDGWSVQSYVKPHLFFVLMRDVFTISRFWTIGPMCLLKRRYFSTGSSSCSSLYGMLYNTFLLSCLWGETSSIHYVQ